MMIAREVCAAPGFWNHGDLHKRPIRDKRPNRRQRTWPHSRRQLLANVAIASSRVGCNNWTEPTV